eukprot:TRINITY_DN6393_c0_g1_i4.p1 TRINITY_DN6393_c0_g1~~TRINITY_DN6393_c0_g1_i4.p1  ORF type:complete len:121 (-),score=15.48 TRINITY_DN6393_c0_g1_i4:380-742(-)
MVIVVDIAKETPLGDSSSSFHSLVALRGVKLLQPEILSRYIRKLFHCKKSSVSASSPSALHSFNRQRNQDLEEFKELEFTQTQKQCIKVMHKSNSVVIAFFRSVLEKNPDFPQISNFDPQ